MSRAIDIQALSYSTVKINRVLLLFCNLWFTGNRLTTNTDVMYQSLHQSTKFSYRAYKIWTAVLNIVKI